MITTTWEAEIRRTRVPAWAKVREISNLKEQVRDGGTCL
jgi:hypothetical protein